MGAWILPCDVPTPGLGPQRASLAMSGPRLLSLRDKDPETSDQQRVPVGLKPLTGSLSPQECTQAPSCSMVHLLGVTRRTSLSFHLSL